MHCPNDALPGLALCAKCTKNYRAEEDRPWTPQCAYINQRGQNKGKQCPRRVVPGTSACPHHATFRFQWPEPEAIKPPPELTYKLSWKKRSDLSWFQDGKVFTDVTLRADGKSFSAHKLVLSAASDYYRQLFTSNHFKEITDEVTHEDISSTTLGHYLDLLYGKEVVLKNWREAFDLFGYFNRTLLCWDPLSVATFCYVPPDEYEDYRERLDLLFPTGVPSEVDRAARMYRPLHSDV